MLSNDFFPLTIHQPDPTGELTALLQLVSRGPLLGRRGMEGRGRNDWGRGEGRGKGEWGREEKGGSWGNSVLVVRGIDAPAVRIDYVSSFHR